jgi:GTPase involved in cell partitioning and DNA repair
MRTRNLEVLEKELAAVQRELQVKTDALVCREMEMEEQGSIHQAAISELKAQLVSLQSQTKALKNTSIYHCLEVVIDANKQPKRHLVQICGVSCVEHHHISKTCVPPRLLRPDIHMRF